MARNVRNSNLEARSNRLKLPARREPYWQRISKGCHLGYRRLADGNGTWIARYRPELGARTYQSLGAADDFTTDDLNFAQAQEKARDFFGIEKRKAAGEFIPSGPYTVAAALRDYFGNRERRGHKSVPADRKQADAHIIPALGAIEVEKLTKSKISGWHHSLAAAPARIRTSAAVEQRFRQNRGTEREKNSRRSTANRVLAILRAALNFAHSEGRAPITDAWEKVENFKGVNSARVRFLSDDESRRLVNACHGDLRALVTGALLTGCRYGELTRLVAEDFHSDVGTIHVRISKSGKPRHVALSEEGRRFFAGVCLNKSPHDLLFTIRGHLWGKSAQQEPMETACRAARVGVTNFHALRHTYASRLVMKGVPLAVVAAQLGHVSITMVEKHYGHLAPNYVADTVRAAFGDLGVVEQTNVTPMKFPA
jgi:integrase